MNTPQVVVGGDGGKIIAEVVTLERGGAVGQVWRSLVVTWSPEPALCNVPSNTLQ